MSRKVLTLTVAIAAVALSACNPGQGGAAGPGGPAARPRDPVDIFITDPARAESYAALQRLFPTEYVQFRTELDAMAKAGATPEQLRDKNSALWRRLMETNVDHTTKAPTPELVALAQKQRDLMLALQRDNVDACAKLARNKFETSAGLTPAAETAMSAASAAHLAAMKAGMDRGVTRSDDGGEAAAMAFFEAIAAQKAREAALNAVFADEASNPAPADVCEGGVAISNALASMQPEQLATMQAVILTAVLKSKQTPAAAAAAAQ